MRVQYIGGTRIEETPDLDFAAIDTMDADHLAEYAGRLCYRSFDRPNPATATNEGYLSNILSQQHYSVLEHASATFRIRDISRSLTHELIRHRQLSYSQLSQRFVDESESSYVIPPAFLSSKYNTSKYSLEEAHDYSLMNYRNAVEDLIDDGYTRKEARQAARAFLLNAHETDILVTGNMRAWREVIGKRNHPAADAEIRALAEELLHQLKSVAPNTFQDM